MPDPALHGNGYACPACQLRREADPWQQRTHPCNRCNGTGRIAYSLREAYERRYYWSVKTYA